MSGRTTRIVIGAIIVVALLGAAVLAFLWFSGGSGEASGAALADNSLSVTLTARAGEATEEPTAAAPTAEATEAAAEVDVTEEASEATEVALSSAAAEATEAAPEATEAASASADGLEAGIFNIVPEESEASFELTEDLRGQFTVVRGITQDVGGQIFVDFSTPASSEAGVIRINARTMATDNEFRNRAIRGQILLSAQDEFEFIEFTPTGLEGLPETVSVGETVAFQIVGDLVVKGISQPVTFDVTLTPVSADRLEGTATTTVQRAMYGLNIPNVPGVANVSEDVTLTLTFIAARG